MRIDVSLLPALAAAFMLVFARIGAMVMLLPGFGETNIPVRIKLAIALALTLIILPLHRAAYTIDMQSLTPLMVLLVQDRKSTRLNSSHSSISYAVFCLKKKTE